MANEKVISTQALIEKFQQALDEKWGYIWETAGEEWTAAKQSNLEKTTDADRANSRKYGSKWIGHMVADCSGLFSWAFKKLGGYMYHGSDTMWNKYCTAKGELISGKRDDGKELKPGTAVFTHNKSTGKRGHVGLYIGGGYVIEAKGAYYGVVKSKVTDSKWVEWGELKGLDYDSSHDTEPQPDPEEKLPTLRKGSKGKYVTLAQTKLDELGYSLGSYGIDGDFGSATEKAVKQFQKDWGLTADGIIGPKTWDMLMGVPAKETRYTVTIKGLKKGQAEELKRQYPDATIKEE